MQRNKEFKHKRIRYYRAVIDLNSLKVNQDYDKLPPAVIIDSFAEHKEKVYFFQAVCQREEQDIVLKDEAMVRLKVPSEKQEEYRKLIEPQKV